VSYGKRSRETIYVGGNLLLSSTVAENLRKPALSICEKIVIWVTGREINLAQFNVVVASLSRFRYDKKRIFTGNLLLLKLLDLKLLEEKILLT